MPRSNKDRTGLIPANLPLYIRCLRREVVWQRTPTGLENLAAAAGLLKSQSAVLGVRIVHGGKTTTYNPWEKRADFFRLASGDTDKLLEFLNTVGVFASPEAIQASAYTAPKRTSLEAPDGLLYSVTYQPNISERTIWALRRIFERSVRAGNDSGMHSDFSVRIISNKGQARVVLTTATFVDALALTLSIDSVLNAKVQKCARPDCGVMFTFTGGHERKYCGWYCGHIESVRKSRKRTAKTKGVLRGK